MNPQAPTILPSADLLTNYEHGKFILSNLAAKRAKQLREGAHPLVRCESTHPLSIALAEIAAGKIRPIFIGESVEPGTDSGTFAVIPDEAIPNELGLLLPALEGDEFEAVSLLDEAEHEEEPETETESAASVDTLADLMDDSIEAEDTVTESEDDTLSLSDIEEQESADDEEDPENG